MEPIKTTTEIYETFDGRTFTDKLAAEQHLFVSTAKLREALRAIILNGDYEKPIEEEPVDDESYPVRFDPEVLDANSEIAVDHLVQHYEEVIGLLQSLSRFWPYAWGNEQRKYSGRWR